MIYVTQGHEKGIGLEIFFKSFLLLPQNQKKQITLIATKSSYTQNIKDLGFDPKNFKELNILFCDQQDGPTPSSASLIRALKVINPSDILVTLPTSKDQLVLDNQNKAGYTEFFRDYYHNPDIAMTFKSHDDYVLLISDHIPLKDVTTFITEKTIIEKTKICIDFYKKYFTAFDEVLFSGINPHVGEGGILGSEDSIILPAINKLKGFYPKIIFNGPYSGDTLHVYENKNNKQLSVYMHHDQALAKFKAIHGLIGLNISMGLPFLRLSVDHGTAFDLYGKNKANSLSMSYLFREAFKVVKYVNK